MKTKDNRPCCLGKQSLMAVYCEKLYAKLKSLCGQNEVLLAL